MIKINIKEPIWKNRSVGIAETKIKDDILVTISYKDTNGNAVYPHNYFMYRDEAINYPTMTLKNGVRLKIIPIVDFKIYSEVDE